MTFFESIFTCNNTKNEKIKTDIENIKRDINNLYRENNLFKNDIKNLEIKLDFKFDNLNNKIDNILLLLKK